MKLNNIVLGLLLSFAVADIFHYTSIAGFGGSASSTIDMILKYGSLIVILYHVRKVSWKENYSPTGNFIFKCFIGWNIVTIIRGIASSNSYTDWRVLAFITLPFFVGPFIIYFGKNPKILKQTIKYLYKYFFILGFILIPFSFLTNRELYSRIMLPVIITIFFLPYIRPRKYLITIFIALLSVAVVPDFRTNIIRIFLSFFILFTYFIRGKVGLRVIGTARVVFFILPLVLVLLAATGTFNIFQGFSQNSGFEIKDVKTDDGETESLTGDTRTFLFVDVFATLQKNNAWAAGLGATAKYETDRFEFEEGKGRYATEVGALNLLLFSGVIGLFLYGTLLFYVSYLAIYQSNNWLCKMIGLFLATKWMLFFLEEFTVLDLNFYFLWLLVGTVTNKKFRGLSDKEIKIFFQYALRRKKARNLHPQTMEGISQ